MTNVRLLEATSGEARVTANFAVWRFQHEQTDVYVGRYLHVLVRGASGLLFRRNSTSGAVEVVSRSGTGIELNVALHAND